MKHTKGPWIHDTTYGLIMKDEIEICALHSGVKANADLIAAAPEMLEALEYCENVLKDLAATKPRCASALLLVEGILSKARGGK